MKTPSSLFLASVALVTFCAPGTAQVAQLSPPAAANDVPVSIVLVPAATGLKAVCSISRSSRQIRADVTAAPTVGTSATFTRDQFCDAWYTPVYNGYLLTGHRFGGLRVWKCTSTLPLTQTAFVSTHYSHEGLKMHKSHVLYSEQHTSATSQGGLKIWNLTSTGGLSFVGQKLFTGGAGNALEIDLTGRVVWQWGDRNNNKYDGVLRVYSTNNYVGNPVLVNTVAHAYVKPYYSKDLEGNPKRTNLLGAMGWDGLRAINVTNATSPVINTVIPPTQVIFIDGVTFAPNTNLAVVWGFIKLQGVTIDFISIWNAVLPGQAILLWIGAVPWRMDDIKVLGNHFYCVGRDRANAMKPIIVKI